MSAPLANIRVLDLSRVLAGPLAAQNLADLGAEVIKVERPGTGDDTRSYGPPWLPMPDGTETRESAYFLAVNRNKKSITLDISKPEGQAIVRELATVCDVLVENYKVGDLQRYGLGYDDLSRINPKLIYCSVTGYGQSGPRASNPGYDFVFQGMGGLMSVTGEKDSLPGGGPQKAGIPIVDLLTGIYASLAITAALNERNRTGLGQRIDCALLDTLIATMGVHAISYFCSGQPLGRMGNAHPQITPYQVLETADGHMIVGVGNDGQYQRYCKAIGRPDLASDARFIENPSRIAHRDGLTALLAPVMRTKSKTEWLALFEPAGVPCGPINDMREVWEEPQVKHRDLRVNLPHASGAVAPLVASPMRFSRTPVEYRSAPPLLGQHTDEVLRGVLGKTVEEIARLRAAGTL